MCMSLSHTFSQLSLPEQKNVIKTLFTALHQQQDEYHRNKGLSQRPPAPARPKRPPEPRTAWDRLRGVMSHRDQEHYLIQEPEPLKPGPLR